MAINLESSTLEMPHRIYKLYFEATRNYVICRVIWMVLNLESFQGLCFVCSCDRMHEYLELS